MALAIQINNLSKRYRLGVYGARTLREDLQRLWWQLRGKGDPLAKVDQVNTLAAEKNKGYVWALKDINLEVEQGEILGIIGKNGAGKSTLLKILSRITSPTTGEIKIRGRLGSLLEVGTGFHPELTGRENIYLNGAILGMTRREIDRKFDDIVDFAGVARYIDTPVKRYSSGMYVRLGFAVAAFLEPDILVVDEVLAVGDAEFQKRAIGKMQEVSRGEGRTVLFVSHNMGSIRQLCNRAILLDKGRMVFDGKPEETINHYLQNVSSEQIYVNEDCISDVCIQKMYMTTPDGKNNNTFKFQDDITVNIVYRMTNYHKNATITLFLYTVTEILVFASHFTLPAAEGIHHLQAKIPGEFLLPGSFLVRSKIHVPNKYFLDNNENAILFKIEELGSEHLEYNRTFGIVSSRVKWQML